MVELACFEDVGQLLREWGGRPVQVQEAVPPAATLALEAEGGGD